MRNIRKAITACICILMTTASFAQVGIGTNTPQKKLHIYGSMQLTNELNVGGDSVTAGSAGTSGQVLVSNGSGSAPVWKSAASTVGDIKTGLQSADHSGWILLNGRALSTLTSSQQSKATALGFSGNLPNAANAFLVQNGTTLGSVSGSNTKTIARNQLPNITLTANGTTDTAGTHTHSYVDRGSTTYSVGTTGAPTPIADDISGNYTTGASGNHSHHVTLQTESINGGVTQQTLDVTPRSLSVNTFVYLGD